MKLRKYAIAVIAMAALTSCTSEPEQPDKPVSDAAVTTTAVTSAAEPTDTAAATDTTTAAKTTAETTAAATQAPPSTEPVSADRPEFGYDTERWMNAHLDLLLAKPYYTVMHEEPAYAMLAKIDTGVEPELIIFSESGSSFAAYSCDLTEDDKLIAFGNDYGGNRYMYNAMRYAFGCRQPNPMSAHETFEIRCFTIGNNHYHDRAREHHGLCLDDCEVAHLEGHHMQGNAGKYADYGVGFEGDDAERIVLADSWFELSPDNLWAVKLESGKEVEAAVNLYNAYVDVMWNGGNR